MREGEKKIGAIRNTITSDVIGVYEAAKAFITKND